MDRGNDNDQEEDEDNDKDNDMDIDEGHYKDSDGGDANPYDRQ